MPTRRLPTTTVIDANLPDQVYIANDDGEMVDAPKSLGADGMLRVVARTARTGVQEYYAADGRVVRRYRPAEEVFAPDSMASWSQQPVTLEHPPQMLDATNCRKYMRGASGVQAWQDGKFLMQHLLVGDAEAVDAVLKGTHRQISNGYFAQLDRAPGISPEGEPYDEVMRAIRGNHVALVPRARGGADLQPRLDSADGGGVAGTKKTEERPMARMQLNGAEREVPDALVDAIQAELSKAKGESVAKVADSEAKATTLQQQLDAEKANAAALKQQLEAAKASTVDEAAVIAKHQARTEAEGAATKHGVTVDAKDDTDAIRRKVIAKVQPAIALDGKDAAFVEGVFRGLQALAPATAPTHARDAARSILPPVGAAQTDAAPTMTIEAVDAQRRYEQATSHLRPIGAHRDSK